MKAVIVVLLTILSLCTINASIADEALSLTPVSLHSAFYNAPTQMTVSWQTQGNTSTIVKYGTSADELTKSATGFCESYLPTEIAAGWHHHVLLSDLNLDTKYYYSVGNGDEMSDVASFVTQPEALRAFHIPVYGDMGDKNSNWTRAFLENYIEQGNPVDFVYHIGDIAYGDDYAAALYDPIYNEWFSDMQYIMTQVPYMTCPGNHESDGGLIARNFTAYQYRFMMPANPDCGNTNMWFSWNYYNIHFVSISTETDYPGAPEGYASFGDQLTWLENDLASVDRSQFPWLIVVGHRPIYSSSKNYANDSGLPISTAIYTQAAFENLLHDYEVDLFFCGHVHSYERMYPTYDNKPVEKASWKYGEADVFEDPSAPIYVVSGAAGSPELLANFFNNTWAWPQPEWSALRYGEDYGLGILHILNTTTLYWEFLKSDTGALVDSFYLNKEVDTVAPLPSHNIGAQRKW